MIIIMMMMMMIIIIITIIIMIIIIIILLLIILENAYNGKVQHNTYWILYIWGSVIGMLKVSPLYKSWSNIWVDWTGGLIKSIQHLFSPLFYILCTLNVSWLYTSNPHAVCL